MSALAASALPSLVMARGHRINNVPEVPLVVDDSSESITKTSKAVALLKKVVSLHTWGVNGLLTRRDGSEETSEDVLSRNLHESSTATACIWLCSLPLTG